MGKGPPDWTRLGYEEKERYTAPHLQGYFGTTCNGGITRLSVAPMFQLSVNTSGFAHAKSHPKLVPVQDWPDAMVNIRNPPPDPPDLVYHSPVQEDRRRVLLSLFQGSPSRFRVWLEVARHVPLAIFVCQSLLIPAFCSCYFSPHAMNSSEDLSSSSLPR